MKTTKIYTEKDLWELKEKIDRHERKELASARLTADMAAADQHYAAAVAYLRASRVITELMLDGGRTMTIPDALDPGWGPETLEEMEKNVP